MNRGFTLIEAMVVVVVIGLLAAEITPRAVSFIDGQQVKSFESRLESMASIGRERAIALRQTVDLQYDSTSTSFQLHSTGSTGNDQTLGSLTVPNGLQPSRFLAGTQDSDATSWKLNFYPDGSSDGGGVQFDEQSLTVSLLVDADTGTSDILQNQLPDTSTLSWQAGDIIHRAQS